MLQLLLSSAIFFQNKLFKKILSGTLSECFDSDQDGRSIGRDLGPYCLQSLVISRGQNLRLEIKARAKTGATAA